MGRVYRHTQMNVAALVILAAVLIGALWWSVRTGLVPVIVFTVFTGCILALFSTLTVAVRDEAQDGTVFRGGVRLGVAPDRRAVP